MTNVPFVAKPMSELPAREMPSRSFNKEAAEALLAIVNQADTTASDGQTYKVKTDAQKAAAAAKRLLVHVLPEGKRARTRVYPSANGKGFEWAVFLDAAKPAK